MLRLPRKVVDPGAHQRLQLDQLGRNPIGMPRCFALGIQPEATHRHIPAHAGDLGPCPGVAMDGVG